MEQYGYIRGEPISWRYLTIPFPFSSDLPLPTTIRIFFVKSLTRPEGRREGMSVRKAKTVATLCCISEGRKASGKVEVSQRSCRFPRNWDNTGAESSLPSSCFSAIIASICRPVMWTCSTPWRAYSCAVRFKSAGTPLCLERSARVPLAFLPGSTSSPLFSSCPSPVFVILRKAVRLEAGAFFIVPNFGVSP